MTEATEHPEDTVRRLAAGQLADNELLTDAARALRSFALRALTVKPTLDHPYPDAPELSPWTRFVEPEARRAHDLSRRIRKHLAGRGIILGALGAALPGVWPELPPEWHDADYSRRRTEGIRNRPPVYRQTAVLNDDIDWLLEEIDWLNEQLAVAKAEPAK